MPVATPLTSTAQTQQSLPVQPSQPAPTLVLPPATPLKLRVDKEISSKVAKVGDRFALTLAEDVMLGQAVAIPKGAHATAEITDRSGKGVFGRSAKMKIQFRTISYEGRDYALAGDGRKAGKGNTVAVIGSLLLFGPFAGAITGTSARFKRGQILEARTVDPIPITVR